MNKYFNNIRFQLRYIWLSRFLIILAMVTIFINGVVIFLDRELIDDMYSSYVSTEQFYLENDSDIEAGLAEEEYTIYGDEDGVGGTDNPILYSYTQVSKALYATSTDNSVAHILEIGGLVFPILFGIVGALFASTDYQNGLHRHRILRFGRNGFFAGKITVLRKSLI